MRDRAFHRLFRNLERQTCLVARFVGYNKFIFAFVTALDVVKAFA
jgi:hypothetical protein